MDSDVVPEEVARLLVMEHKQGDGSFNPIDLTPFTVKGVYMSRTHLKLILNPSPLDSQFRNALSNLGKCFGASGTSRPAFLFLR